MFALTVAVLAAVVGPELEHCRLGAPVFRDARVGFVPDACGQVFVTKDGGATWAATRSIPAQTDLVQARSLSLGASFSDGAVVMGGYFGPAMLRTTDDGATWAEVSLPTDAWLYAMVARGASAWACGSDGPVIHTRDSGKKWVALQATPTDSEDRCVSLDFLDEQRGWVAGWHGSLWSTTDGGRKWTRLTLPQQFTPSSPDQRTLSRVLRVSPDVGFVHGPAGTFRTTDGGATWTALEPLPAGARVQSVGPHRAHGVLQPAPQLDLREHLFARGAGAASLEADDLVLWAADGSRRVLAVAGPPSGEQPRLDTLRRAPTGWTALGTRRAFSSADEGATWRELAALPADATFEQLAVLDERRALARGGGKLFRSNDGGRHWAETTDALDAVDLARELGLPFEDPVSCLAKGTRGTLLVDFGFRGCFGGRKHHLTLGWTAAGGDLAVKFSGEDQEQDSFARTLPPAELRRRLDELHARVMQREPPATCWSTTSTQVSLEVSCVVEGREVQQKVSFTASHCGAPDSSVGGQTSSGEPSPTRAAAIFSWAAAR